MASREVKKARESDCELDLTAMIDVVFLLIIFFILVTEIINSDISLIVMPRATNAIPDEEPPENRLTVNIVLIQETDDYAFEVRRRKYSKASLQVLIQKHAENGREDGARLSESAVIIRSDARVPWKSVQEVQQICMEARLWRIAFSVKRENRDL